MKRATQKREAPVNGRIVLRYNALVGRDPLPRIRELAKALALEVGEIRDDAPAGGKKIRVVAVHGDAKDLWELERKLRRFPAVTAKIVTE